MSILSNSHDVVAYDPKQTKAFTGQRLAKVTYKTDKDTGIKPDSKAVSIPVIKWEQISGNIDAMKDSILDIVLKAQDAIVRNKVESGSSFVTDDDISLSNVITYLNTESSGGRLTGDTIRAWFKETINDGLLLAFASKLGIAEDAAPTNEQSEKLTKILRGYEDSFAKLASGAASFNETQKSQLIKAINLNADFESDTLSVRFIERLSKKSDDDLLMAL
jgi:hypothetical protein